MGCFDPREKENNEHARKGMVIACALLKELDSGRAIRFHDLTPGTVAWWEEHKARDASPVMVVCDECAGTGKWSAGKMSGACPMCLGTGKVRA